MSFLPISLLTRSSAVKHTFAFATCLELTLLRKLAQARARTLYQSQHHHLDHNLRRITDIEVTADHAIITTTLAHPSSLTHLTFHFPESTEIITCTSRVKIILSYNTISLLQLLSKSIQRNRLTSSDSIRILQHLLGVVESVHLQV